MRVPLLNASLTDAVFTMSLDVTVKEANGLFREASQGVLAGILGFEPRPLVAADLTIDTLSLPHIVRRRRSTSSIPRVSSAAH